MDREDRARPGHPVRTLEVAEVSRRNGNLNPPEANLKGQMGSFEESGESGRQDPEGGESMNYSDESNANDSKASPSLRPDPADNDGPTGWLYALNSFLERAFLKADVDTGC